MRKLMKFLLTVSAVACLVACGDDKKPAGQGGGEAATKPGGGAEPAKAGEWKELSLDKLGLKASVPSDGKVSVLGGVSGMGGTCQVMIAKVSDMSPSFENTVKNVEKGNKGGPLAEMKRKDKKDDSNWVVEWTTEKKKFGYASRRQIGDAAYSCGRVSSKEDGHACVIKVCDSLAKK